MVSDFITPVLVLLAYTVPLWILSRIIINFLKKRKINKPTLKLELILFLFYLYLVLVISLTILPLPFARFQWPNKGHINLIPIVTTIKDIKDIFSSQKAIITDYTIENILGNILLFFPLGVFLPVLSKKYHSVKKVMVFAIICSSSIEISQLISRLYEIYRFVDIDDVILNTTGAVLGFLSTKKWVVNNIPKKLQSDL